MRPARRPFRDQVNQMQLYNVLCINAILQLLRGVQTQIMSHVEIVALHLLSNRRFKRDFTLHVVQIAS